MFCNDFHTIKKKWLLLTKDSHYVFCFFSLYIMLGSLGGGVLGSKNGVVSQLDISFPNKIFVKVLPSFWNTQWSVLPIFLVNSFGVHSGLKSHLLSTFSTSKTFVDKVLKKDHSTIYVHTHWSKIVHKLQHFFFSIVLGLSHLLC